MTWFKKTAVQTEKFSIPPKIAKNYQIAGDLSNVNNWKAKIILGNSCGKGQKPG